MSRAETTHIDTVLDAVHSSSRAAISPLAASWCRSALHHGLDPAATGTAERLDAAAFATLREAHESLLAVAHPVLDNIYRSVGRSGCSVVLSDAQGIILAARAPDSDRDAFAAAGLTEGGLWSEGAQGTNGIGTCLYEGAPVVIYRDQHFASRNIGLSCMDAPVHDPQGRLIAALDVSSVREDHGPAMADMIAALVGEAARRIERDYFCRHYAESRIVLIADEPAIGPALVALDRDGLVVGASRSARNRLGLADGALTDPAPLDQLTGRGGATGFADGERAVLRQALARAGGNVSAAARSLGIGRATLYRRMKRAGISA